MAINKNTLAIFTLVEHKEDNNKLYGYGPYVREMNIWTKNFDKVLVVAPKNDLNATDAIDLAYKHSNIELVKIPSFNVKSLTGVLSFLIKLPILFFTIIGVMRKSEHLHFRSPSNVAAIASLAQILFPNKPKTVKYAGNWNPKSKQPLGYRFQKWIFGNTLLTKNCKILVYGKWNKQSKYVIPFHTATFSKSEISPFKPRDYSKKLKFIFLGSLVEGKRPLLVIQIIETLSQQGISLELHIFGDGILKTGLTDYIKNNKLETNVILHGNKPMSIVKEHLTDAHFTLLPSKSEGWPKALAEGMFFGVIPISTAVSCVPWMLGEGDRGILIEPKQNEAVGAITNELSKGNTYLNAMAQNAQKWSQQYTIEKFEDDIKDLITR